MVVFYWYIVYYFLKVLSAFWFKNNLLGNSALLVLRMLFLSEATYTLFKIQETWCKTMLFQLRFAVPFKTTLDTNSEKSEHCIQASLGTESQMKKNALILRILWEVNLFLLNFSFFCLLSLPTKISTAMDSSVTMNFMSFSRKPICHYQDIKWEKLFKNSCWMVTGIKMGR